MIFYYENDQLCVRETCPLNFSMNESTDKLDVVVARSRFEEAGKTKPSVSDENPAVIYPQFHMLTADKVTRNKTFYTAEAHKGKKALATGQHSFTKPYPIPVIGDHRSTPECGSQPSTVFGRVINAAFVKNTENGKAHVAGLGEITHPEAIDEILCARWLTGSLGSSVENVTCSICSKPVHSRDEEPCPHERGQHYKPAKTRKEGTGGSGEDFPDWIPCAPSDRNAVECYAVIPSYKAREYSRVVIPSDDESLVTVPDTQTMPGSHFTPDGSPMQGAETLWVPRSSLWVPMSPSSRASISLYGERYIDLVSNIEKPAAELGLFSGNVLHEHLERILAGEDESLLNEADNLARSAQTVWVNGFDLVESEATVEESEPATESTVPTIEVTTKKIDSPKLGEACGPGVSYRIKTESDFRAAVRAIEFHHGDDKARIKANILKVGRSQGWTVPKKAK